MTAAAVGPEAGWREGMLALADGSVFEGEVLGFDVDGGNQSSPAACEVVFNTVMTGYQEVLTDPSYAGQMIAFTYPHIGNYGVAPDDDESRRPFCRGLIVRELTGRPSNWRAVEPLAGFLRRSASTPNRSYASARAAARSGPRRARAGRDISPIRRFSSTVSSAITP